MVKMKGTPAKAWMKTLVETNEKIPGKQMQAGVMRVDAGHALEYSHW